MPAWTLPPKTWQHLVPAIRNPREDDESAEVSLRPAIREKSPPILRIGSGLHKIRQQITLFFVELLFERGRCRVVEPVFL